MYEHLFESTFEVALAALTLAYLVALLNGRPQLGIALLAFGFAPAFAAAFFFVGLLAPNTASHMDMAAGFFFEFIILALYCRVFIYLRQQVSALPAVVTDRAMLLAFLAQISILLYLLSSDGFGLFSEGSRIEFLFAGAAAKYIIYAGVMLAALQAALLASRITSGHGLRSLDYATILLTAASSILSGSKGGFFLWVLSALCLVDYRKARLGKGLLIGGPLLLLAALLLTFHFVAEFLGVEQQEFASLLVSRFFLNNDARALAFDLQGQSSASATLLSESFRSVANAIGSPPLNLPLGQLLYELHFGFASSTGANTSTMALIVFYSERGEALGPTILASAVALSIYAGFAMIRRFARRPIVQLAATSWAAVTLHLFTQDFLAFQLVLPLGFLGLLALRAVDGKPAAKGLYQQSFSRGRPKRTPSSSSARPAG